MTPLRGFVVAGAALSLGVLIVHAWFSLTSGHDVNLVSGVWLALAHDVREGLFYRDLIGPAGYGGTRYFPLFFTLIAAFMRIGLDPIAAGYAASLAGMFVLVAGAFVLLTQFGLRTRVAIPVTILATVAPYFVQQTTYSIRAEPLAAGLAVWGLACVAAAMRRPVAPARWMILAALFFTLAIAAKPTSVYAPAGALLALALARRNTDALRLGAGTALGILLLVAGVEWLSDGRFLISLRATALAGETPSGLLTIGSIVRPFALMATSHLLTVVGVLALAALVSSPSQWGQLPVIVLVANAGTTMLALATPGTILTNQIVELYVMTLLFLGWFYHTHARVRRAGAAVLAILLMWTAGQNVARIVEILRGQETANLPVHRPAIAGAIQNCGDQVLAESPLLPILAGRTPILLDPFAFRVVAAHVPVAADDLIARVSARQFACVVLEYDPKTPEGAAWYRHVHLGQPVLDAILQHYQYRSAVGEHRFYTPGPVEPRTQR